MTSSISIPLRLAAVNAVDAHWWEAFRTAVTEQNINIEGAMYNFQKGESGHKCLSGVALNVRKQHKKSNFRR